MHLDPSSPENTKRQIPRSRSARKGENYKSNMDDTSKPMAESLVPGLSTAMAAYFLVTSQPVCGSDWLEGIIHSGVGFFGEIIKTY